MLSRVADSLYWMSRYLERAEHTARLLGVALNQMLEQTPTGAERRWERLIASLRVPLTSEQAADPYRITRALIFETLHQSSIVGCITAARENARQVREQISSEMWEQLNRLYLQICRADMAAIWETGAYEFLQQVKEGAHLFQGVTDATMSHGEGWQWIQVGRFIERADSTAALLDVHFNALHNAPPYEIDAALDYLEWVGLLKSCTAFEAYCKVYTADIQPDRIAEFLLLNAEFPRSVRFAADMVRSSLQAIARASGMRSAGRAERLAGRLGAALDFAQVDEIMADNMHAYLMNIQRQCDQIHTAIYQTFITYPVEVSLAS